MVRTLHRRSAGFTLPELIAVLVIAGLLAATAAARWDQGASGIDELGFVERTLIALRHAQRRARADACEVRVTVAATGFQLDQRAALCSGAFNVPVAGTAGEGTTLDSAPPPGMALSSAPATFYYDAAGAIRSAPGGAFTDVTITIGTRQIQLVGSTGHATS